VGRNSAALTTLCVVIAKESGIDRYPPARAKPPTALAALAQISGFWYSRAREPVTQNDKPSRDRTRHSGGEPPESAPRSRRRQTSTTSTHKFDILQGHLEKIGAARTPEEG
jgi:hypothetical protein